MICELYDNKIYVSDDDWLQPVYNKLTLIIADTERDFVIADFRKDLSGIGLNGFRRLIKHIEVQLPVYSEKADKAEKDRAVFASIEDAKLMNSVVGKEWTRQSVEFKKESYESGGNEYELLKAVVTFVYQGGETLVASEFGFDLDRILCRAGAGVSMLAVSIHFDDGSPPWEFPAVFLEKAEPETEIYDFEALHVASARYNFELKWKTAAALSGKITDESGALETIKLSKQTDSMQVLVDSNRELMLEVINGGSIKRERIAVCVETPIVSTFEFPGDKKLSYCVYNCKQLKINGEKTDLHNAVIENNKNSLPVIEAKGYKNNVTAVRLMKENLESDSIFRSFAYLKKDVYFYDDYRVIALDWKLNAGYKTEIKYFDSSFIVLSDKNEGSIRYIPLVNANAEAVVVRLKKEAGACSDWKQIVI